MNSKSIVFKYFFFLECYTKCVRWSSVQTDACVLRVKILSCKIPVSVCALYFNLRVGVGDGRALNSVRRSRSSLFACSGFSL